MNAIVRTIASDGMGGAGQATGKHPAVPPPPARHRYAPAPESKIFGAMGTALILCAGIAGLLVTFQHDVLPRVQPTPLAVTLLPPVPEQETPPEPQKEEQAVEKQVGRPSPSVVAPPITPTLQAMPLDTAPAPALAIEEPDPEPPASKTPAPEAPNTLLRPRTSQTAPDAWESQVLARLQAFQRYPATARARRRQGVVYIRFRMDRNGRIRSASIAKTSGVPALDRAALETLRRAEPLPKIPLDRPDEIELSVPIEFFLT